MGFSFKSVQITLTNYLDIFKECSPDILDEIRSAILDDTNISRFIEPCGNDSYKLNQIRLAIREYIPMEYITASISGRALYLIRQGFARKRDMSSLLKYIKNKKLLVDIQTFEALAEYVFLGTDISKVDFTIVPRNLVTEILKGLYQGYPMWLIVADGCKLTEFKIHTLIRGWQLGVDMHPFLSGDWNESCILLILSYAHSVDLGMFMSVVNDKFDSERLKVLLYLASTNVPIKSLCVTDTNGYPVYNHYQMYELGLAIDEGTIQPEMFDVTKSDMEISLMRQEAAKRMNKSS